MAGLPRDAIGALYVDAAYSRDRANNLYLLNRDQPVTSHDLQPFLNTRDDGPFAFLGLPTVMRATGPTTNGAFGLLEHLMVPPGFASPYHTHAREDEAFYVLEGEVAFICAGRWMIAAAGAFVFGPRGIPHGFKVQGAVPARMLVLCAPSGFEQFVLDMSEPIPDAAATPAPPDMAKLIALATQHGIDIHGPLPE
jgi:quercetin dioxygenase-like cupin family protein